MKRRRARTRRMLKGTTEQMTSHSRDIMRFPHDVEPFIRTHHMCFILLHVLYFKRGTKKEIYVHEKTFARMQITRISFRTRFIRRESRSLIMTKQISYKMWQWFSLSFRKESQSLQTFKFLFHNCVISFHWQFARRLSDGKRSGRRWNFHLI